MPGLTIQTPRVKIYQYAVAVLMLIGVGAYVLFPTASFAETVPESCFTFSEGVISDYNPDDDPACVSNVTVPSMIDGETVTTIGEAAFYNTGITGIYLPDTIILIEGGAFANLALTNLHLDSAGDLRIDSGATFEATLTLSSLSISAGGDLSIGAAFQNTVVEGELELSAGNDLTLSPDTFNSASAESVSIEASGDITIESSALYCVDTGILNIKGGGDITTRYSALNYATVDYLAIEAEGDVTLEPSISWLTLQNGASIVADGDVFLGPSVLSGPDVRGELIIRSGGSFLTQTGVSTSDFSSVDIIAGEGIAIIQGSLSTTPSLETLRLVAETGEILIAFGSLNSLNALQELYISTPSDLTVNSGGLSRSHVDETHPVVGVAIDVGGDVSLATAFGYMKLDSFTIDTDGSLTVGASAFTESEIPQVVWGAGGDMTFGGGAFTGARGIEAMSFVSGGDILLFQGAFYNLEELQQLDVVSEGNVSFDQSSLANAPALRELAVVSAGGISFTAGSFVNTPALQELHLQAEDSVAFTTASFQDNQLVTISLPSTTEHIGSGSFSGSSTLTAVYLNGSTPIIDESAFRGAGYVDSPSQVRYIQLYTDVAAVNPGGYVDTIWVEADLDGDGELDRTGGYIVNPAHHRVSYMHGTTELLSSEYSVGELSSGENLVDYLVASNPEVDFSAYYRAGQSFQFDAPAIAGYITPTSLSGQYQPGFNAVTFLYTTPSEGANGAILPDPPNTGLRIAGSNAAMLIATSITLLVALFSYALRNFTSNS